MTTATGVHTRRSPLLDEIEFMIRLKAEKPTTTQINHVALGNHASSASPERARTTPANSTSTIPWARAATRMGTGKRPGNLAPIA